MRPGAPWRTGKAKAGRLGTLICFQKRSEMLRGAPWRTAEKNRENKAMLFYKSVTQSTLAVVMRKPEV